MPKKSNLQEYIIKLEKIHGKGFYNFDKSIYKNNNTKMIVTCPIHGDFESRPREMLMGSGCPKCGKGTYTLKTFIKKAIEIHGDKYDYSKVVFIRNQTKVEIVCKEHGSFWLAPNLHLRGIGCAGCSGNKPFTTESFIAKSKELYGDYNYNYDKTVLVNYNKKPVIITCPIHGDFETIPNWHINNKSGCPLCRERKIWTFEYFVEQARLVHGDIYDYYEDSFTNSVSKTKIHCKKHGDFWQCAEAHIRLKCGCPICKESHGEKAIRVLLEKYNIAYQREKKFDGCKLKFHLRFDFYIPSLNLCIEYDGWQHYRAGSYYASEKDFENIQIRDKIKNDYCKNNNIGLIRLSDLKTIEKEIEFIWLS